MDGELTAPDEHEPPGLLAMAGNLARAVAAQVVAGNPIAAPEVQAERRRLCFACPIHDHSADRCGVCGCSAMDLKRSWSTSRCPLEPPQWDAEP